MSDVKENVERVEVLKGPAAALYGGGEPGGMINYVTRKASFESSKELVMTAPSDLMQGIYIHDVAAVEEEPWERTFLQLDTYMGGKCVPYQRYIDQ